MLAKDALGKQGEDLAARHFVGAGFTVLARNWRCPVGEIDIVARDGDVLVIAEVKTRPRRRSGRRPRRSPAARSTSCASWR